jgi:hypothetical protein
MPSYEVRLFPKPTPDEPAPMSHHHSTHVRYDVAVASALRATRHPAWRGYAVVALGEGGEPDKVVKTNL